MCSSLIAIPNLNGYPILAVFAGTSSHYDQIYYGFSNALNYTSPKLHSVVVEDLTPNTSYFYRVGDLKTQYWSEVSMCCMWNPGQDQ